MGDPSGGQVPGGANFGDIRKRMGQMAQQAGPPPQGQPNPAPPAGPTKVGVPSGGGDPVSMAVAQPDPINPYNSPTGKPAYGAGGAPPPQAGSGGGNIKYGGPGQPPPVPTPKQAVPPGADIGPGAPPPQAGGGPMPTPQNPSPGGPRGQLGMMPPRRALGAPQAGGFQQPTFGLSTSGSAGQPNVPNPFAPSRGDGGGNMIRPGTPGQPQPTPTPTRPPLSRSDQATMNLYGPKAQAQPGGIQGSGPGGSFGESPTGPRRNSGEVAPWTQPGWQNPPSIKSPYEGMSKAPEDSWGPIGADGRPTVKSGGNMGQPSFNPGMDQRRELGPGGPRQGGGPSV